MWPERSIVCRRHGFAPPRSRGMLPDGGGLYLQVTIGKDGSVNKSWLIRYAEGSRRDGTYRERMMGLGPLGTVGLAAARERAAECRRLRLEGIGRVEVWRGGFRSNISVAASFVWRCLSGPTMAPFPHPAHRTGHADFPHPALGQNFTPSPTARRAPSWSGVRARSARKGARVDRSRPCVA